MTIKKQLLQEIESTPDILLAETLDFLRFLKTKQNIEKSEAAESTAATKLAADSTLYAGVPTFSAARWGGIAGRRKNGVVR